MMYLVERSMKGRMICLCACNSIGRVIARGAIGPKADEAISVTTVVLISSTT